MLTIIGTILKLEIEVYTTGLNNDPIGFNNVL